MVVQGISRIRGGDPIFGVYENSNISVFPAYAGVILATVWARGAVTGISRIRGGDPHILDIQPLVGLVFPAYAGVIPKITLSAVLSAWYFPHTRG